MLLSLRIASVAGLLTALMTVGGCGGGSEWNTGKVSGHVMFQGKPVADVSIQFIPQATQEGGLAGKAAIGKTDADGRFTLSTYSPGDGAVIGHHKVMVGIEDPDKRLPGTLPDGFTVEVKQGANDFEITLN